jgi:prophage regulatory protein
MPNTLLRLPAVKARSGLSRSTVYLRISQGLWTHPVNLGGRAVAWPADEVDALNAARIAGHTDEQVRGLVCRLEAARLKAAGGIGAAE